MDTPFTFVCRGKPLTWQRASRGRYGQSYTPKDRENKMSEIRDAWATLDVPSFARHTAIAIGVRVFCIRPTTHYRTDGRLKPWAMNARPMSGKNGGDVSNFVKLVEDALSCVAYHDDTQIAEYLPTGKWYTAPGEMPRTEITLAVAQPMEFASMEEDPVEQLALLNAA